MPLDSSLVNDFLVRRAFKYSRRPGEEANSLVFAIENRKILERQGLKYLDAQVMS